MTSDRLILYLVHCHRCVSPMPVWGSVDIYQVFFSRGQASDYRIFELMNFCVIRSGSGELTSYRVRI